jgi:hypothetical protein
MCISVPNSLERFRANTDCDHRERRNGATSMHVSALLSERNGDSSGLAASHLHTSA